MLPVSSGMEVSLECTVVIVFWADVGLVVVVVVVAV